MAGKQEAVAYLVKTKDPNFCGQGAGGVQFANGQAVVTDEWLACWYREKGYDVTTTKPEAK